MHPQARRPPGRQRADPEILRERGRRCGRGLYVVRTHRRRDPRHEERRTVHPRRPYGYGAAHALPHPGPRVLPRHRRRPPGRRAGALRRRYALRGRLRPLFRGYGNLGLEGVLATLPPETQVFCGHEYTASNLRFALSVDGANPNLQAKAAWVDGMRAEGRSTIPTTIGGERLWNPFMRADQPELKASVGLGESADPIEVMAAVRAAKDRF
mmetsp:Transcript_28376/g.90791  ORF Transcript_28376/g.90791 Transcript_28376/m.90791 type:complete len:211 (-) Transcript_28376:78-710(-)